MKNEEVIAEKYLKSLKLGPVEYEPTGESKAPDFMVGANTGVEVRRLNENDFSESKVKGLEQAFIPVTNKIEECLRSFDSSYTGTSYGLDFYLERPISAIKQIPKSLCKNLQSFLDEHHQAPYRFTVVSGLDIEIIMIQPRGKLFLLFGGIDEDSGGWVEESSLKNITHCIVDKLKKIGPYKNLYREWILVLVDYIGIALSENTKASIKNSIDSSSLFDRVDIIDTDGNLKISI